MTMNTKALLRLADKLEGKGPYCTRGPVPRQKFDISTWIDSITKKAKLTKDTCGTAACACGWAAVDPWFRRRGFTNIHNGAVRSRPILVDKSGSVITYDSCIAVASFFGLKESQVDHLFMPSFYDVSGPGRATPKTVAKRIRKFVRHYETTVAAADKAAA